MSVVEKPQPPEPELVLPPNQEPEWPRAWRGKLAAALPLLGLTPTELAILSHIIWKGKNRCWANYEGGEISEWLAGLTDCDDSRIRTAIPSLLRSGYLSRWIDARHRPVLQLTTKLVDAADDADRRQRTVQAVGSRLWERVREQLGGSTAEVVDEIDRVADLLPPGGTPEKRWSDAAWQIIMGTVVDFEAARAARR